MTHDIVFHHYPNSPFSEKIRAIFGYKKLHWKSVLVPVIMPKPDLVALTGGYRRTPVMQIGSDIVCDTALICDVLEAMAPAPTLYPPAVEAAARILAQWADSTLFWTAIAYAFQPAGMAGMFKDVPPEAVKAFSDDRKAFRGGAPRMHPSDATGALKMYLERIAGMLQGREWLLGDAPSLADFSVYHCLWTVRRAGPLADILQPHAAIAAWMDRIAAFGHGTSERMSAQEAIDLARSKGWTDHSDKPVTDLHGIAMGSQVTIAATDVGTDPIAGTLAVNTAGMMSVRRTDARAGDVTVHFPRIGFALKKAEQEN
jgi:glutathione S-transferase